MSADDNWPGMDATDDVAEDDPWPGTETKRSAKRTRKQTATRGPARAPSLGNDSLVSAVDGDTARLSSGRSLRLYGADAPELKQQGWDRRGNAVPIGQQARNALTGLIPGEQEIGQQQGMSYGRPVAPVSLGGQDAGQTLIRQGSALAAPNYMRADPERSADYMQAERLARLNRQGLHDTYAQTPDEYRRNPLPAPDRETVAQFWDTPTPFAGMRPEDEKRYTELLDTAKSGDEVAAFVRTVGFDVDPKDAQRWIEARDKYRAEGRDLPREVRYGERPKALTNQGDGVTGAAARGVGAGALAGGLDEAGALVDTLGLTDGRENVFNSDRRLADIWSNNQEQNSSILGFDDYAHPYAQTAGELAGGLIAPFGAGARTIPELARVGAAYGGVAGFLGTDGGVGERTIGGAIGVPLGGVLGAGAGKALQVAAPYVGKALSRLTGRGGEDAGSLADDGAQAVTRSEIASGEAPARRSGNVADDLERTSAPMPMAVEPMPSLSEDIWPGQDVSRATRMDEPLTEAQRRAMAEGIEPGDMLPIAANEIGSVEEAAARDAGRYAEAKVPNERTELTKRTVRNWMGSEVPKVGPVDLVGFVRLRGGLKDSGDAVSKGGDLKAMGMTNASRKGMDFVGQEHRFGPLVNDNDGMSLDEAAELTWEAGYFPDHTDRPDVNDFLGALGDTYNNTGRRFLPEDSPEIERFYGTQADRYQLEQQRFETGEPVYQDRSAPAEEPQPFPPPEAYEEWPSGGPDFAGNIRLEKLGSPQDISRALATTEKRIGFDAATRGRVTQAETERLAADLGMTPEKLLARRKGQAFNAEEALASRQILAKSSNELVNMAKRVRSMNEPGEDVLSDFRQAWVRHVAIQEQVSGMTAEAGRALQQFRQMADSRAVKADVLTAMVKGGGGRHSLQDVAQVLIDAVELEPGKFNALAEKAIKPKWRNKVSELYINFLLSWPQTHAVNITSNTLTAIAQVPEHAAAAVVGSVRQMLPKASTERITGTEVGQRAFGLLQGAREGASLFSRALKTGEPADFISAVEGQEHHAIKGLKGEVLRTPTRLLTAEDEFFKGVARRMELNGLAARKANAEGLRGTDAAARIADLAAYPTDEMLQAADKYGRYVTYQSQLGEFAQGVSTVSNKMLIAKFFLPFVRTPTNLLKFAVERSPAAPLLTEWKADFRAGGARRDLAIARMLVGTGFGAAMYQGAAEGRITGSTPSDPKKARLLIADGWKPYSIKVGDTYYSYKRLDPFSTTIGVAADLATLPQGMSERQQRDKGTLLVASIMGNLASKTWLSGVSDLVGALHDPERNADRMVQRLVGALLIPNIVAGTARTLDPVQRETETVGDALQSRIPGMRDDLLPRRNIWGEVVKNEGGIGPDFLSPVWASKALEDPVNYELLQIDYAPGYPSRKVGGRELTPEEFNRYVEKAGKISHENLGLLVGSSEWEGIDDEGKAKAAKDVVDKARKAVRSDLFGASSTKPETKLKPAQAGDQWPGVDTQGGDTSGDWPGQDMPQRDVIGGLEQAIPGVRLTSGYRTEEYQADMRRRGYKPARNSGHLSASALDILPPPGKSMTWLAREVRKLEPDARMLNEGDHLHVTFPGWYGAPAIGGAKDAGIRNPMSAG